MATVCLHNFLREYQIGNSGDTNTDTHEDEVAEDSDEEDDGNRGLRKLHGNKGRNQAGAKKLRGQLTDYFMNRGSVDWQWKAAGLNVCS